MSEKNNIIKNVIDGGLIGAALGASLKAFEKAKDTEIPVLYEEDGSIFRLYPDGRSEFVREIEQQNVNIPETFSLDKP